MCDYSLEMYRSRPARIGERYETHRFVSGSIGFISTADPNTAVCMAADTSLKLENLGEPLQKELGLTSSVEATFTRIDLGPYHDGVRFADGTEITLQRLGSGVMAYIVETEQPRVRIPGIAKERAMSLTN